ncbi:DNA helicase [Tanacetum coccineum]
MIIHTPNKSESKLRIAVWDFNLDGLWYSIAYTRLILILRPEPYRNMASVSDPADKQSGNTWIARHVITKDPTVLCCILLDKEGLYSTYRISRFSCEETKKLESLPSTMSGMSIPFIIWNEVAHEFDVKEYNKMEKPVVIPVSSCWVIRKYGGLQLTATPATHYYLNPNIVEVHHILNVYQQFIDPAPALPIQQPPYGDEEQEQTRNQWSLESLLKVIPHNYKRNNDTSKTALHATENYCFRAIISDGTTTTSLTCFSPEAYAFVPATTSFPDFTLDIVFKQKPFTLMPPTTASVTMLLPSEHNQYDVTAPKHKNTDLGSLAIAPSVRLVDLPLPSIDSKPRHESHTSFRDMITWQANMTRAMGATTNVVSLLLFIMNLILHLGEMNVDCLLQEHIVAQPLILDLKQLSNDIPSGRVNGQVTLHNLLQHGLLVFEAREIERVERLGAEKGADKGFSVSDIEGRCDTNEAELPPSSHRSLRSSSLIASDNGGKIGRLVKKTQQQKVEYGFMGVHSPAE